MRRPALWILLFAFAAFFFGWKTYEAWTTPSAASVPPAAAVDGPPLPGGSQDNVSRAPDLGLEVAVIVTRPLFRPDRQPSHENAAAAPQRNYEAEIARFSLVGILLQEGAKKGLVLGMSGGRQDRWEVGPGDSLPGFAVREVQPDGLLLSADGKDYLLPLYAGGPKAQTGAPLRTETAVSPSGMPVPGAPQAPAPAPRFPGSPQASSPPQRFPGAPPAPGMPVAPYSGRSTGRPPRGNPTQR